MMAGVVGGEVFILPLDSVIFLALSFPFSVGLGLGLETLLMRNGVFGCVEDV